MEHHPNKERAEFNRMSEIDAYFSQEKQSEMTLIALSLFVALYIERTASSLLIGLAMIKLFMLLIFSSIEKKCCSYHPVWIRTTQFWLYRFILFLQLVLLLCILITIASK